MKNKVKYIGIIIGILVFIWQSYAVFIDMYNFKQLNKARPILESISKDAKKFYNMNEFNTLYNIDIKPIKNCYDISNSNGSESYIFGFKLESLIYMYIYGIKYYSYPRYDYPYAQWCVQGKGCYDRNREAFEYIISHTCKEY